MSESHGHMWPNHKRQRGGFSLFCLKQREKPHRKHPPIGLHVPACNAPHRKLHQTPAVKGVAYIRTGHLAIPLSPRWSWILKLHDQGVGIVTLLSLFPPLLFFFHAQRLFAGRKSPLFAWFIFFLSLFLGSRPARPSWPSSAENWQNPKDFNSTSGI